MKIRVKDNIPLSTKLRKAWDGSEVVIFSTDDSLLVKRVQKVPSLDVRQILRSVGNKVTTKDITHALREARA